MNESNPEIVARLNATTETRSAPRLRYTITNQDGEVYATGQIWNDARAGLLMTDDEGDITRAAALVDDAEKWNEANR